MESLEVRDQIRDAKRTVFVLGAGFTRAFCPRAPLLRDEFPELKALQVKYRGFLGASRTLEVALARRRVDIERLMSRLDRGMPYDADFERAELTLLMHDVKRMIADRLEDAKKSVHTEELNALARFLLWRNINCVTFNYDDILDSVLFKMSCEPSSSRGGTVDPEGHRWGPSAGYGFSCPPSTELAGGLGTERWRAMLLLKLHGSINWRLRHGSTGPHVPGSILHHEQWYQDTHEQVDDETSLQLAAEPFIVPPVLMKAELIDQPVLRIVWALAFGALQLATEVVFLGYSLPVTDIAARVLFREAISRDALVRVVIKCPKGDREKVIHRYRSIGVKKPPEFEFRCAREWVSEMITSARLQGSSL